MHAIYFDCICYLHCVLYVFLFLLLLYNNSHFVYGLRNLGNCCELFPSLWGLHVITGHSQHPSRVISYFYFNIPWEYLLKAELLSHETCAFSLYEFLTKCSVGCFVSHSNLPGVILLISPHPLTGCMASLGLIWQLRWFSSAKLGLKVSLYLQTQSSKIQFKKWKVN